MGSHRVVSRVLVAAFVAALAGCDDEAPSGAVSAEDFAALVARVTALEEENRALAAELAEVKLELGHLQSDIVVHDNGIATLSLRTTDAQERLSALETKTAPMSRARIDGQDSIAFDAVNVYVRNGEGGTATTNGVGNLIVGYHEQPSVVRERSGSHNLVLGVEHDYSSYGGVIAGEWNNIAGEHALVLGGSNNHATGQFAVVVGGGVHTASGGYSTIAGGYSGQTLALGSTVVGGASNVASGDSSTVVGGSHNVAAGWHSSISGGKNVQIDSPATNDYAWKAGNQVSLYPYN